MVGLVGSGGEGVAALSSHYYFICGDGRSFLDEGTSNACFPGSSLVKNINQWSHECKMWDSQTVTKNYRKKNLLKHDYCVTAK